MIGTGSIVNAAAIVIGGLIGLYAGNLLNEKMKSGLLAANALCVVFIGIQGALSKMTADSSTLMCIVCFSLGALFGEWLDIEGKLEQFGRWLKKVSGSENDTGFVCAFITASLTVCIGAMAVIGGIEDGMNHNPSILFAKSLLDFVIILVMAGSLGKGTIFSAVPVFILQFSITLLSWWISPYITPDMLDNVSLTGSMMIFCVGVNLLRPGTFRIANMLPTLLFAAAAALI